MKLNELRDAQYVIDLVLMYQDAYIKKQRKEKLYSSLPVCELNDSEIIRLNPYNVTPNFKDKRSIWDFAPKHSQLNKTDDDFEVKTDQVKDRDQANRLGFIRNEFFKQKCYNGVNTIGDEFSGNITTVCDDESQFHDLIDDPIMLLEYAIIFVRNLNLSRLENAIDDNVAYHVEHYALGKVFEFEIFSDDDNFKIISLQ
ncbi:hypothetical protein [Fructilactobacillus fructivorans]|uniref:Uncharacterized protein n=1 Tax=Fructilactobacillus fructivorans TaxID=1614 RepID=A0A0C1M7H0_9LACO|nr:hypothetical protein [Fructilactobacillus fructivorans]KID42389.1 hypothetical protein LfDm3_0318 [Fructilactobacillus fructivorans]KRK58118.1 hypothetical protein FC73_GL000497 [Fructilactobacillus fructivorans]KRN13055.1 hypothetical protein IV37_GL000691 [Fructilactobacillus fructivorans]KRN41349.1 hypothetical protein IV51_GL000672 [Fructilactobacillus fructivorans]KRN42853.1 hypothetical protein IV48_GL001079 [Fructilactobacillus fructivorans]